MSMTTPFLTLEFPCIDSVLQVRETLTRAGLQALQTFDLQATRAAQVSCPCPHHGTVKCDCQMVVLLVYGASGPPVTIVAHGYGGQTVFHQVEFSQGPTNWPLWAAILSVLEHSQQNGT